MVYITTMLKRTTVNRNTDTLQETITKIIIETIINEKNESIVLLIYTPVFDFGQIFFFTLI